MSSSLRMNRARIARTVAPIRTAIAVAVLAGLCAGVLVSCRNGKRRASEAFDTLIGGNSIRLSISNIESGGQWSLVDTPFQAFRFTIPRDSVAALTNLLSVSPDQDRRGGAYWEAVVRRKADLQFGSTNGYEYFLVRRRDRMLRLFYWPEDSRCVLVSSAR